MVAVRGKSPSRGKDLSGNMVLPGRTKKRFKAARARERILVFGEEGCGKTEAYLQIAEMFPNTQMFVVDTDDAVQRMLETDHPELDNVSVEVAQSWEEFEDACGTFLDEIEELATSFDKNTPKEEYPWLVIDFSDTTWDMVQSYFTEQVFDKGIAEYFLQARRALRGGGAQLQPLEGWTDWQVINKLFQGRWKTLTQRGGPFHLYITAKAKSAAGKEARSVYKGFKVMPEGEKRMGYRVHTILLASAEQKKGEAKKYYLDSVKDRGRKLLDASRVVSFPVSYLVKTAGWVLPE